VNRSRIALIPRSRSTISNGSGHSLVTVASKLVQPLNELSLFLMARPDRADAAIEIISASLFYGQRPKIGKQAYRLVISSRAPAFDLGLDLAPDVGTALLGGTGVEQARVIRPRFRCGHCIGPSMQGRKRMPICAEHRDLRPDQMARGWRS
ncbi:MAG: hypothetical protein KGL62_08760, partial [Bradyrhizobium sp.]|nr:hypothetical protein [Bradyrhizobium sp.]